MEKKKEGGSEGGEEEERGTEIQKEGNTDLKTERARDQREVGRIPGDRDSV